MKEPKIKVGILTAPEIEFILSGNYKYEKFDRPLKGKMRASLESGKIVIDYNGQKFNHLYDVVFEPVDFLTGSIQLNDVVIGKNFHWERKENQRFAGTLKLIVEGNEITAVNILSLEEYLMSVISSEMSPNSSYQFLKTHAIVSRSWILSQMGKSEKEETPVVEIREDEIIKWYDRQDHKNFDVCADDHCQRYQGITKVISKTVQEAIDATRGLVLTHNKKICDTRYSKCCGGITENFENVWQDTKLPYLTSVVDYKFEPDNFDTDFNFERNAEKWIKKSPQAFCNTTDEKILSQVLVDFDQETKNFYRWKVEYKQDELKTLLKKRTGVDFGEIKNLKVLERGLSSRIIRLQIVGTKKTVTIGKELEIRKSLSESHLYSSAFYVETRDIENDIPGRFILYGAGWGHGVGLCQIGAAVMSETGYKFDEILTHYFRGSKIEKLYL